MSQQSTTTRTTRSTKATYDIFEQAKTNTPAAKSSKSSNNGKQKQPTMESVSTEKVVSNQSITQAKGNKSSLPISQPQILPGSSTMPDLDGATNDSPSKQTVYQVGSQGNFDLNPNYTCNESNIDEDTTQGEKPEKTPPDQSKPVVTISSATSGDDDEQELEARVLANLNANTTNGNPGNALKAFSTVANQPVIPVTNANDPSNPKQQISINSGVPRLQTTRQPVWSLSENGVQISNPITTERDPSFYRDITHDLLNKF